MSLSHGEVVKVLSLAFKPGKTLEEEGSRLWIGTNVGELQEIDIATQEVVSSRSSAHTRREIIKIYRHRREMWTLDDDGKLLVWPPDESGSPDLQYSFHSFRLPKGHSFSIVVGDQLWLATGKEIRIFRPGTTGEAGFSVLTKPLLYADAREVTSGTVLNSQQDKIYFGHADGKVTMYSTKDYSFLGVATVSSYKINSMAGVGDYLWAAYKTGMIYVYDTRSSPWKVKKDWAAHDGPISSIMVDPGSVWKLGRLNVCSLGEDQALRIWDGTLEDDWLGRMTMSLCLQ